jgi:hypothetical protein
MLLPRKMGNENVSGRRDSNPLPTAWEAVALPGELLPLLILRSIGGNL